MAASDENELRQMLNTGYQYNGPAAVRYPRGTGTGVTVSTENKTIAVGESRKVRTGEKVAILSFGALLKEAEAVAEKLNATLIDMRFIKPLDTNVIDQVCQSHTHLVTLEENALMGGAGSAVNEYLMQQGNRVQVKNLGLPDHFVEHGDPKDLLARCGLTADKMTNTLNQWLHN